MTAATIDPRTMTRSETASAGPRLSFGGLIKSEAIKLLSLRSTYWGSLITVVAAVGIAAMMTFSLAWVFTNGEATQPVTDGLWVLAANQGVAFVFAITGVVMGVLVAASEYASGSIRSTLAVAPRRGWVLTAKAVVTLVYALIVAAITEAIAIGVAVLIASSDGLATPFGLDGLRMALGAVFYFVAAALVGLGLGFILRSTAGGITAGIGLFFVVDLVLRMATANDVVKAIRDVTPAAAGARIYTVGESAEAAVVQGLGGYGGGFVVLAAWIVAALIGGYVVLKKRDA
ncbi:MAG: ABC transporter permease [Bifidobacteriaceae bacterium]|jgi:ABC-2 type transport system permease protein|nr:ABC transporter permease [Bifidobacteriaceae bacterium]